MAGRGPAPKQHHQRERDTRRRQADSVTVTPDGVLRGPELSTTGRTDWHPMTLAWWESWRRSPQAQLFEETDWNRLLVLAPLYDGLWTSPRPSAAALSEIRLNEERFGATYLDRLRAKIVVGEPDGTAAADVVPLRSVSRDSIASRMGDDE